MIVCGQWERPSLAQLQVGPNPLAPALSARGAGIFSFVWPMRLPMAKIASRVRLLFPAAAFKKLLLRAALHLEMSHQ